MSSIYRYGVWFAKGVQEYTKSGYEKASRLFEPYEGCNVKGRSFMITGANSGIGKETALAIAKSGGTVHMVCRNEGRATKALEDITSQSGNENIILHILDISKPTKVYEFVEAFKQKDTPLHVLVNNAGCLANQRTITDDDIELNFATNTLGTYILTTELIDHLKKHENPQVITVTSGGMLLMQLDSSDLQFERMKPFDGNLAYAQNKRQQVVMTDFWANQHPEIQFTTMHPGWADTPAVQTSMPEFHRKMSNRLRTSAQGADTLIWLCLSPKGTKEKSGGFYQDRVAVKKHLPLAWTKNSLADEKELMNKLVELSSIYKPKL